VTLRSRLPELRRPEVTWESSARLAIGVVGIAAVGYWLAKRTTQN